MKILIIDEEIPYPLNSGKRIRSFNLTTYLSRHHRVSYLAYADPDDERTGILKEKNIDPRTVRAPRRKKSGLLFYLRLLLNLFSRYPYVVSSHYTSRFQKRLNELLKETEFDLILVEWTPYAIYIKDVKNIKSVIVAHNIESDIWERYHLFEKNIFRKFYIGIQKKKMLKFEKSCFFWARGAVAVSRRDADQIKSLGVNYDVKLIENGVDLDYFSATGTDIDPATLVFTGSMDWRPNQDAARYFVHDVFPLLKEKFPQLQFFVVGRNPTYGIKELGKIDGVVITGTVDDVRPYMARATIYVVPLRIGGGSRLKILEAMAMKKAVVSTPVGAEGLRAEDGENILIGNTPREFADQIISCLRDDRLRSKLEINGRKTVEQYYGWEQIGKTYNEYLLRLVDEN